MLPDDPDKTPLVEGTRPSESPQNNAGRRFGEMQGVKHPGQEQAGDIIGAFRLCEVIGEGGFGIVWRAEQSEPVRREVAVKILKLGMDSRKVLSRFKQERQALATLEHPGIATLLDAGVTPDGRPWFAMELVRGAPITHWCAAEGVPLDERLRLFQQVCLAVHHAHRRGIIHRDLKPSNVLVTRVASRPVAKVIDFGIAKSVRTDEEASLLTLAGQRLGTPCYMSPEQTEDSASVDVRSDVYALGVLLYEMLTEELPIDGKTVGSEDDGAIKRAIRERRPERPSKRSRSRTTTFGKEGKAPAAPSVISISPDIDWITLHALEKEPGRRYQTAAEFAEDVNRHLDREVVRARPPSITYAAGRWMQRRKRALMAAALGVLGTSVLMFASMQVMNRFDGKEVVTLPAPAPAPSSPPAATLPASLPAAEIDARSVTNTLGMKFVPVPIIGGPTDGKKVLFSIWETRVQDYEVFAKETQREWPKPDFEQGPTHPAVNVLWEDAAAFCAWLTVREHTAGKLPATQSYRPPSDHEWSCAMGIGSKEDAAQPPKEKSMGLGNEFSWGSAWPPPEDAGNFMSQELQTAYRDGVYKNADPGKPELPTQMGLFSISPASLVSNPERRDGYATTAPVGSFPANQFGLYDLAGNVWEWCEELFQMRPPRPWHVWRGASFASAQASYISTSRRDGKQPKYCRCDAGFRVVLSETRAAPDEEKIKLARAPLDAATKDAPFVNSLGMKFVPVPGTEVLFCIHETRYQDFVAYGASVPSSTGPWCKNENPDYDVPLKDRENYPVHRIDWEEAQAFCQWLSWKEGRTYRLPSDHEWSYAAGIGDAEKRTPDMMPRTVPIVRDVYPWGTGWPPPPGAGNYPDESWKRAHPNFTDPWLQGYDDGFAIAAPVMSFKPNHFGLYDLGGNVGEWVADWKDSERSAHVLRGHCWWSGPEVAPRNAMLLSGRAFTTAASGIKHPCRGFRCVLEKRPPSVTPVFTPPPTPQGPDIPTPDAKTSASH